ncbi:MAG: helical backbone metal receptor [Chitinophagales bacterium]|nr:helical backbone metal receptor [Chitinophagales bacterium]MDW8427307.1 helical backbone metal receptor [Chitinophagales bacterium]
MLADTGHGVVQWLGGRQPHYPPQRIVSLVPSLTELLADLGLEQNVVGITKFCERPAQWRRVKTIVGGTKAIKIDRILALHPDLVLANKEENIKEQITELAAHVPVLLTDIHTADDALKMIRAIAESTRSVERGHHLVATIEADLKALRYLSPIRAAYLIWHNPIMAAGSDTFISNMMQHAGFVNVFEKRNRYPQLSAQQLTEANPDWLLLASEPFPFSQKHVPFYQELLPASRIVLVDGQMFSWYGSRMQHFATYVRHLRSLN